MPKETTKLCAGFVKKCRGCGYRFTREDKKNKVEICPHCQTPRQHCTQPAVAGRDYCRYHGGNNLAGINHWNYQGKGWAKVLPTRLHEAFNAAIINPDLLNLSPSVALYDARIEDVFRRLGERGASNASWREVHLAYRELIAALSLPQPDPNKQTAALRKLESVIEAGYGESKLYEELDDLQERQRKVVDSEVKRASSARTMVAVEAALMLFAELQNAVRSVVTDPKQLAEIQTRWSWTFDRFDQARLSDK